MRQEGNVVGGECGRWERNAVGGTQQEGEHGGRECCRREQRGNVVGGGRQNAVGGGRGNVEGEEGM